MTATIIESDIVVVDLTDHEFDIPCESPAHKFWGWAMRPAEWAVICPPAFACGCPPMSTSPLWCDRCLQYELQASGECICPKHDANLGATVLWYERIGRAA